MAARQPYGVEINTADGVFIKQMVIPDHGTIVPQHSHQWDHTSMVASGSVAVWKGREFLGIFEAPTGIFIKAGIKHTFQSLEDNTIIYCIHNLHGEQAVRVLEEHDLLEEVS
jgi:quercetin dioxygenase-like cupin family protein